MEILLYGIVGDEGAGLDAAWLVTRINSAPDDITVRINSLGGLVFDGFTIYNALKQSPRKVTIYIDGVAGSIASVIAMAGDEIIMADNALMMIHKPQDGTYGEAPDLRAVADRLDMFQEQLVRIYAERTGMALEELNPLLDAETWMTAQEALSMKFVDSIAGASTATNMLDATKFGFANVPDHPLIAKAKSIPAPVAVIKPETIMPDPVPAPTPTPTPAPAITTEPAPAPAPAIAQPVNVGDAVNAALAAERARASSIRNEASRAGMDRAFADGLVDEGLSIDVARERIIDAIATNSPQITNRAPATIPAAQFQVRAEAMANAIANRANPTNQLTEEGRAFGGRRLVVLARDFLESTGISTRAMGDVQVAQEVFRRRGPMNAGMHSTSDFPSVLANTVSRTLRRAYELAPQTFRPFCRQATVPDFRPVSRVALSDISPMQPVAEGGEYQYATVGDSAEQYVVGKYGAIIAITWESIVNDDLSAFDRLPTAFGMEASQVESDVVWAILLGNPAMSDGTALFHATHGNLAAAGAAISVASLTAGRTRMRTQKSPKGRFLNNTPSFLLCGPLKELEANQFTSANYVATKNTDINPEFNRSLTPLVEARITDLSWFLSADPNKQAIDTVEYAYLAGYEGLQTEERQGFETDGVEIKARTVFGAKAIDWRGMDKNPGA